MIHRELKMLVVGDHVEYVGKGIDHGNQGEVVEIHYDGELVVRGDHGTVWHRGDILDSSSFKTATYRFWKFVNH